MPTNKEIIRFLLSNDARTRTKSRDVLTKKILKYSRKQAPSFYWGFYGSVWGTLIVLVGLCALMVLDESSNFEIYTYLFLGGMIVATPIIGYAGFRLFRNYFAKFPEEFPGV